MLDKIEIHQNILWKFGDEKKNTDFDILPVEFTITHYWRMREGFKMKYGATQQIKGEIGEFDIQIKDCQTVENFDKGTDSKADDDDDDDFDEEDEDEESQKKQDSTSKLKRSALG